MDENLTRQRMQDVLDLVVADISSIRTGRSTPALVQDIIIPAYGDTQKLKVVEMASITAPDPLTIVIDPWDKSVIGDIRKGIQAANVGLNPVIDGQIIRISTPPLTTEDREKYIRLLRTKLENGKIMLRQIRSDAMRDIKKAFESKELSEDEKFQAEKKLQEITDDFVEKISQLGTSKEKELLQ